MHMPGMTPAATAPTLGHLTHERLYNTCVPTHQLGLTLALKAGGGGGGASKEGRVGLGWGVWKVGSGKLGKREKGRVWGVTRVITIEGNMTYAASSFMKLT